MSVLRAVGVELPAVERALDLAALDRAAVAEVGAEVRAERVLHVGLAVLVAPGDEVAAEVVERPDGAELELVGPGHQNQPNGMGNG